MQAAEGSTRRPSNCRVQHRAATGLFTPLHHTPVHLPRIVKTQKSTNPLSNLLSHGPGLRLVFLELEAALAAWKSHYFQSISTNPGSVGLCILATSRPFFGVPSRLPFHYILPLILLQSRLPSTLRGDLQRVIPGPPSRQQAGITHAFRLILTSRSFNLSLLRPSLLRRSGIFHARHRRQVEL